MSTTSAVSGTESTNTQYRYSVTQNSRTDSINMQDFLMLVVAQMQNQDMNSSQDNGQFMAQMAQMASMQAMQELTAAFMSSMTMSYIGKYVKAEAITDTGARVAAEGIIDRVNFNGGDALVLIENTWFKASDIYEISASGPEESSVVPDVDVSE